MGLNDDDNIIFNYSNELYNNCSKILNDYDINDDINKLFSAIENYSNTEFEKYNSNFSENIETIILNYLNSEFTILDENTSKILYNLITLITFNSDMFSNILSLYNIKEIPNPESDPLIHFINYEIKDNFNRFYLYSILIVLDRLMLIIVNRESTIYNGILLWSVTEIKNVLEKKIKKKEITFLKEYILKDFKLIYEKTYSKILKDMKNKNVYNIILKKYIETNLRFFEYYNRVISRVLLLFYDSIYLLYNSSLTYIQSNDKEAATIILPWFSTLLIIYITYINVVYFKYKNIDDYLNIKQQINVYLNDLTQNFNIISESNYFSKELDNISLKFNELLEIMYKEEIGINTWLMTPGSNLDNIWYITKYILFLFIEYDSGISFQLEYIREQINSLFEKIHILSCYYYDNRDCIKIYTSIIEDIERKDLFIKDSEILFTIENLSHRFDKNIIFVNVNLIIPKNKWICFYGNSGSGKTTLCNILLKQLHPDNGLIKYMDKYPDYKYTDLCKDISYVTASPEVFENTIIYNIVYGINNSEDKEIKDKINYYIKKFGLDMCDLNDNVNTLSTGQKQRVSIIRCILHDSPIFILDEITSNIDNEMEKIILEEIRKIQKEKNKTVIHITHNLENKVFSDINLYILNKDIIRVK